MKNLGPPLDDRRLPPYLLSMAALLTCIVFPLTGCHLGNELPKVGSKSYKAEISSFYVGLSALQVGDDVRAESSLAQATGIAPGEPAGWVNWGILALRQRNFDVARQRFTRALELSPHDDQIYYLLGVLESARGNSEGAIKNLGIATGLNPRNFRAAYQLASEIQREGNTDSNAQVTRLLQGIIIAHPENLVAHLDLARISAKSDNPSLLHAMVNDLTAASAAWPADAKQQLAALQKAAAGPDIRAAATRTIFLRNVLMQVPQFRASLAFLKPQPGEEAQPFTHFLLLPSPSSTPAQPDRRITFSTLPVQSINGNGWNWVGALSLSGEGALTAAAANSHTVQLASGASFPFPGGSGETALSPESLMPIDFNYDFKMDLVLAGAGGLRFMRQDSPSVFTDVTAATKLPPSILSAAYTGAWAVDIEADGDLDIVLGTTAGAPTVLRNNGDGTFQPIHPFAHISGIRQLIWADLNGDGNPDASLIDGSGRLHVFLNQRDGNFVEQTIPANLAQARAIAAADVDRDGVLDLVVVQPAGTLTRLSFTDQGWVTSDIARLPNPSASLAGEVRLRATDVDNNGAVDLILIQVARSSAHSGSGAFVWLADENGKFNLMSPVAAPPRVFNAADIKADGNIALLGLSADGQPQEAIAHGTKNYHWQIIRPRARQTTGDQRINSFGIGGEIEVRSALLTQKQPIDSPQLHFGLGEHTSSEVARILWPNGSVRAEFALKADQQVLTEQRLKGSCPFLFAWNGRQMDFVKDAVPWGSAIGLRINALGTASIAATEEWYKIGGDQLAPHDGYYDLRISGELWETYYYDHLALMAVDHPAGTDIFTDERFVVPAVKPAIITVSAPHAIRHAIDDNGHDVTEIVSSLDGRYLDNFGRGPYQGVTRDHYVEIDLGDNIPAAGPLYLIAKGWLHPSDSSINVAISQGSHEMPRPLSLEVVDRDGKWHVAQPNLGFPAGRKKTCLIDLTGLFVPGSPHRLRLRTNLEVYWDQIQWAQGSPGTTIHVTRLDPSMADLHYRGYSVIHQANPSSPEIPDYNHLASTTQTWRDLPGFYTCYGDVRELLMKTDDRYVIMNAGDEMSLRFPALSPPAAGWTRDYVIAGDGWIKDGDYNSTYSATIQPLPYHARKLYDTPPGPLEEEWVYRHHPEDWQTYQTRYVTAEGFTNALRSSASR